MSKDARNSLIALASVSVIFGSFYLLMWLLPDDLRLPSWLNWAALAVILSVSIVRTLVAGHRRRDRGVS